LGRLLNNGRPLLNVLRLLNNGRPLNRLLLNVLRRLLVNWLLYSRRSPYDRLLRNSLSGVGRSLSGVGRSLSGVGRRLNSRLRVGGRGCRPRVGGLRGRDRGRSLDDGGAAGDPGAGDVGH
jgi:hypothetical protein